MKKTLVFATVFLVSLGMVSAVQGHDGADDKASITNNAPDDNAPSTVDPSTPTIPDKPGTALDKGLSGVLPADASPTAQSVLNTIDEIGAGQGLGDALSDLLGNSDEGNQTE